MNIGIICEYNPLHLGHRKQILRIREEFGPDCGVICLMSGNYVQRGMPAVLDKTLRARAALACGADLVLELPVTGVLSSAEGFAAAGVRILSPLCDRLCFGTETGTADGLMQTAEVLLSDEFPLHLRTELDKGLSFPAAREAALRAMGHSAGLLAKPNDILAVEYCKAILAQGSTMAPFPILRQGNYHSPLPDGDNPSATAVRTLMLQSGLWLDYVPQEARALFRDAPMHSLEAGERAILGRLRTMTDAEFEALPYGSEGLWRKFMHACRSKASLEGILAETKSRRYTRTRLDRMVMCAFLGLTREELASAPPYTRVLAFNDRGRAILAENRKGPPLINAGQKTRLPFEQLEGRIEDLYGLFCTDCPEPPGREGKRRVCYDKTTGESDDAQLP